MFETTASKLILFGFIFLLISIPTGSFLLHQRIATQNSQNYSTTVTQNTLSEVPKISPLSDLIKNSTPASSSADNSGADVTYGPTLKFAVSIEGRPSDQQQGKFFVGIAEGGSVVKNPQYLLSYTVNVPNSGVYSSLSLAGLTVGNTYTAYIKGPAQLVTGSSFTMSPTGANLNSGNPIPLITGDVNEDNVIDSSDYNIVKNAIGYTPSSQGWNPNLDFDMNGIINTFDLNIITKNLGKIGDGGPWYSKTGTASSSATLNTPSNIGGGRVATSSGGYWLWIPTSN